MVREESAGICHPPPHQAPGRLECPEEEKVGEAREERKKQKEEVDASCDVGESTGTDGNYYSVKSQEKRGVSLFPFIKLLKVPNVPEWKCFMTCHAIIKFYFKPISFLLQK